MARLEGFVADDGRTVVPEPVVKELLRERGVATPAGVVVGGVDELTGAATRLRGPLVLKAFGPGIVHKSDVGAVALGLEQTGLEAAGKAMADRLAEAGLMAAGFLVEEQAPVGVELIIGVVRDPAFGPVVALGLGGTLTEVLDRVAVRLCPLSADSARQLVRTFPAAAVLDGLRGAPPADVDALVSALLAIAGADGLVAELGDRLAELECNPIRAGSDGCVALDARLVLLPTPAAPAASPPPTDFSRLFRPRAIAVAGASTSRSSFGNRAIAAYRAMGWTDGLYAIHPTAMEVDGVPAAASVADLGEPIDYLLVAVPAERCPATVRSTGGAVPFVHVISGGFREASAEGADLEAALLAAAREVGARLVGPNCIGVYSAAGRQTFQLDVPKDAGRVGVVSQSGGLGGDIIKAGAGRGIAFSHVITVGNSIDVTAGELAEWMIDDPDTAVLGLYLEGTGGGEKLVHALRRARGRVPVVVLLGGQSRQGAVAVMSHTGALVGERRAWDALAAETGTTLVSTLEHLLGALGYVDRWCSHPPSAGTGVLVIGMGGGASVLATDACDRAGLDVMRTADAVRAHFRSLGYGAGTSLANPVEIPFGPAAPVEALRDVLEPLLAAQPYADVLVHINVQAYFSYGVSGIDPLLVQLQHLAAATWPATRLAVALRNLDCAPALDRERVVAAAIDCGLPLFHDLDEAAIAIAAMQRFDTQRLGVAQSLD